MTKKVSKKQTKLGRRIGTGAERAGVIVDLFRSFPAKKYTIKNLASAIGSSDREGRQFAREIVASLIHQGLVEEVMDGKYRLKANLNTETYEGVVDMLASGSMYVTVEGLNHDVFIPSRHAAHALHGDRVKLIITRTGKGGVPEGEILEVLQRSDRNYVGIVELSPGFAFVKVDSRKVPVDIFVPLKEGHPYKNGQKVLVHITEWPETMKSPRGEILEVFGQSGENNAEMHAILAEFDLPYKFDEEVERAAEAIPDQITEKDYKERRDFRGVATFTIDPADAKDFDDALSIRSLGEGKWEVGVHIADVTHYVTEGSVVDVEGENRATSVYLVDRTVPMLPEHLSNGLCSLRPNEEKLCFSAVFELDGEAQVSNQWFGRTVILSDRRFTYAEAQEIIEGKNQTDPLRNEVLTLNALARKLRAERFRHGSISFEREEAKFELDENGKPLGVYFKEQKESNQLIEEFMLLANRKVAEFVGKKRGAGANAERTFVYRVHDKPNSDKLARFSSFITRFGYKFQAQEGKAIAREMNRLMEQIKGKSEENVISTLAVRTMAKATYTTDNIGHYGLAFDYYTHFTSPIRRYPDMMVHRLLARYLAGGASADKEYYEHLCEHSSEMEVRAAEAERASVKYKMVEFMLDKLGQTFDGHISGITDWGIYVELNDTHIEGMVALRDMNDDFYAFDEDSYCVTGNRTGRTFTLGDEVQIRVLRADLARKQLDFELVASYDFNTHEAIPVGGVPVGDTPVEVYSTRRKEHSGRKADSGGKKRKKGRNRKK